MEFGSFTYMVTVAPCTVLDSYYMAVQPLGAVTRTELRLSWVSILLQAASMTRSNTVGVQMAGRVCLLVSWLLGTWYFRLLI